MPLNQTLNLFLSLPGYTFFHNDSVSHAGGTAIYICELCDAIPREDLYINIAGECEATFVEIITKQTDKNVIIGQKPLVKTPV